MKPSESPSSATSCMLVLVYGPETATTCTPRAAGRRTITRPGVSIRAATSCIAATIPAWHAPATRAVRPPAISRTALPPTPHTHHLAQPLGPTVACASWSDRSGFAGPALARASTLLPAPERKPPSAGCPVRPLAHHLPRCSRCVSPRQRVNKWPGDRGGRGAHLRRRGRRRSWATDTASALRGAAGASWQVRPIDARSRTRRSRQCRGCCGRRTGAGTPAVPIPRRLAQAVQLPRGHSVDQERGSRRVEDRDLAWHVERHRLARQRGLRGRDGHKQHTGQLRRHAHRHRGPAVRGP